ncbi:MAG: TlpA disulfide reductase family protein [Caldimonas sp.]
MTLLRKALPLAALAIALAWIALPGALRFGADPPVSAIDALPIAPLQGGPAGLAARAAGRPLVVNLWATWCGPCRHEMPLLAEAQRKRSDIAFAFANQGEDAATAQRYLADGGLALDHVLLDPGKAIGAAIGSRALPITLFYAADGRLIDTHVGALTAGSLEAALRRIAPIR